jgi:uncharacterized repeat protein (TIGR01451 family)
MSVMVERNIAPVIWRSIIIGAIGLSTGMLMGHGQAVAQSITPTTTTAVLQSALTGATPGVTISNLTISANVSGKGGGVGTYSNAGGFPGTGLVLRTGTLNSTAPSTGNSNCTAVNCDVTTIEFDVVPKYNNLGFQYSFFSWEYPEFVGSRYNDNLGIIVTGPGFPIGGANLAQLPNSNTPIQINTINGGKLGAYKDGTAAMLGNAAFYFPAGCGTNTSNLCDASTAGAQYTLDGGTVPLQNALPVQAGQTYHVKIILNDVGDSSKDSQAYFNIIFSAPPNTSISKSVSTPGPVLPGTELTYTLRLSNQGLSADVVNVSDAIPANSTYVAASASNGGALLGTTIDWSNLPVPAAICANVSCSTVTPGTTTLTFKVQAGSAGTIQNTATFATIATPLYMPTNLTSNTVTTTVVQPPTNPHVLLVKRITAINGDTQTVGGDNLAVYKNEPTNPYDDNSFDLPQPTPIDTDKWIDPNTFLIGGVNGGNIKPGDEMEYTIYFLSAGDTAAKHVRLCDRVPTNVSFIPTAFNSGTPAPGGLVGDRGIQWLHDGALQSLTNMSDGDQGQYFPPGVDPISVDPTVNCGGANTNGAVVVQLGDLPQAIGGGQPPASYGFVRFKGRVK